ncbi:MAG: hypothetical protein R3F36_03275 [Candidatus Competibacteraceae bacterium]
MLRLTGTTLVVGLGKSGLSAVRALKALGATVAVTDSRVDPPGLPVLREAFPDVPCHLGGFAPEAFAGAARLLVSPGWRSRPRSSRRRRRERRAGLG